VNDEDGPLIIADGLVKKVYDDKDWNVITLDHIMDTISSLAISSYDRPAPPEKV
jgi:hypothetical protein